MTARRNVRGRPPIETPTPYRVNKEGVPMLRLHIYLPLETVQWIDIEARRSKQTRSDVIHRCVSREVLR